ncbi:hypothetical protein ACFC00_06000 [Streptomyces adustus]|uniref:hypothetical protein n=1 Tax=Streptomyces adustus TaxID=1609272 RepID=UPI0035DEBDA7
MSHEEQQGDEGDSMGISLVGLVRFGTLGDSTSRHGYAHAFTVTLVLDLELSLPATVLVPPLRKAAAAQTAAPGA